MKPRGQVLLPALAAYGVLMIGFLGMIRYGQVVLTQMRLQTAAEAAALSTARAQAELLNKCAMHNLLVNAYVNLSYHGMGAMQESLSRPFQAWLVMEQKMLPWSVYAGTLKGHCASVGRAVAQLNGAEPLSPYYPRPIQLQLEAKDMWVWLLRGYYPAGLQEFRDAYYARQWEQDKRRAQPTHVTAWLTARGRLTAAARAKVYLDLKYKAPLHNGGFPRLDEKWGVGDFAIQSFYPQFNARLISTPPGWKRLLEMQHRLGGV